MRFVRYADDCNIFVKSEMSANRVMKSVTSWLERKLFLNLQKLNKKLSCHFTDEQIFSVANTRLGLYRQAKGHVVNFLLSPKILAIKKKDRPGLVNPLNYYLS